MSTTRHLIICPPQNTRQTPKGAFNDDILSYWTHINEIRTDFTLHTFNITKLTSLCNFNIIYTPSICLISICICHANYVYNTHWSVIIISILWLITIDSWNIHVYITSCQCIIAVSMNKWPCELRLQY